MRTCWSKTPASRPGQLFELTVIVDGVFFTDGFAAANRRTQDVVLGPVPTRIEGSPGQRPLDQHETGQRVCRFLPSSFGRT